MPIIVRHLPQLQLMEALAFHFQSQLYPTRVVAFAMAKQLYLHQAGPCHIVIYGATQ
jgi:hypothetical protein